MDFAARIHTTCRCLQLSQLRIQQTKKPSPLPSFNQTTHLFIYIKAFSPSFSTIITPLPHISSKKSNFSLHNQQIHSDSSMDSIASTKRPCFLEENCGLALLADIEAGYSGQNHHHHHHCQHGLMSKSMGYAIINRSSFRSLPGSSPRSGRFYDARYEDQYPHFLEACHLCKKPLQNKDIFMYRGDTPFCSEECRQEQMDMDEAKEKNRNLSSSMKAMRNKEQRESTSPNKTQGYSCVRGTVAAAS